MRYCGEVEFVIRTPEEWRLMPDDVFEATFSAFEAQLRAYRKKHADWRKTAIRCVPILCQV